MTDIVFWPRDVLKPARVDISHAPFSRTGGRTLGGTKRSVRTDRGYWNVTLESVGLYTTAKRRVWEAISAALNGTPGLVVVPAWAFDTAPYASGSEEVSPLVTHSDGSTFDDGSKYRGSSIVVKCAAAAAIGDTSIQLEIINAASDLTGVRFSYQYALYKTGPATVIVGNVWTVPLATTIRAPIPAGAELEFDHPDCMCHLADDRGMDVGLDYDNADRRSVSFVEATDYWSDLAAGLI